MIGIPVLDQVSWRFHLHTCALVGKLSRNNILELCFINRMAIDRARQTIVETAIHKECEYLLFIDDDTLIPLDTVERLMPLFDRSDKVVAATGFCYQRGYRYMPMIYRYEDLEWGKGEAQLLQPFPDEPFQISAAGMGISILKVSLLKELMEELGDCFGRDSRGTEDFYFFSKAHQMGYETWCDPSVEATHMGEPVLINSQNATNLRHSDHGVFWPPLPDDEGRATKGEAHCGT